MDLNALRHLQSAGMQQYLLLQQQQNQQQFSEDGQQQLMGVYARAAGFAPVQLLGSGQAQSVRRLPLTFPGDALYCFTAS